MVIAIHTHVHWDSKFEVQSLFSLALQLSSLPIFFYTIEFYTIEICCFLQSIRVNIETLQTFLQVSNGEKRTLLLMAVPSFFLGIVVPGFLLWLWYTRSKDGKETPQHRD